MRTTDMREMGDARRRLPGTSAGLALGGLAAVASLCQVWATAAHSPRVAAVAGAGLFLAGLGIFRVSAATALGTLRRRRAFEPDRVRETAVGAAVVVLLLAGLGALTVMATYLPAWFYFLDLNQHRLVGVRYLVAWLLLPLVAALAGLAAVLAGKESALRLSAWGGRLLAAIELRAAAYLERFVRQPGLAILELVEARGLAGGEGRLGSAVLSTGQRSLHPLPAVLVLVGLGVVLAVLAGLLTPGIYR
jgi:hypothetical protein